MSFNTTTPTPPSSGGGRGRTMNNRTGSNKIVIVQLQQDYPEPSYIGLIFRNKGKVVLK